MTRRHGRNGAVYLGATNGAVAVPLTFQASWSINMVTDKDDVTAFQDSNKVYVGGLPEASGGFSGFLGDATSQTYVAAVDGLSRNFYLYADATNSPNVYWFGTILPDFSADGSVSGPVNFKATWNAATKVQRYTPFGGLNT
jgi:hypothetical protein